VESDSVRSAFLGDGKFGFFRAHARETIPHQAGVKQTFVFESEPRILGRSH